MEATIVGIRSTFYLFSSPPSFRVSSVDTRFLSLSRERGRVSLAIGIGTNFFEEKRKKENLTEIRNTLPRCPRFKRGDAFFFLLT